MDECLQVQVPTGPGSNFLSLEDISSMTECPVCLQRTEPEDWVQCRNGHHGCQSCFSRLTTCPMCRTEISATIRTFSLDAGKAFRLILKELRLNEKTTFDPMQLLKIFVCDLCGYSPSVKPIYQCQSGHLICKQCFEKYQHCWTCALSFDCRSGSAKSSGRAMSEIRCLAVENLLSRVTKRCRFSALGCEATITSLSRHELECEHMQVDCVVLTCFTRHSMKDLLDHLLPQDEEPHLDFQRPADVDKVPDKLTEQIWVPKSFHDVASETFDSLGHWSRTFYLKLGEKDHFFLSCTASNIFREFSFTVFHLGPAKASEKFIFRMKFLNSGDRSKEFRIERPVTSVAVGKALALRHPNTFKLSYEQVQAHFSSQELRTTFEVALFEVISID